MFEASPSLRSSFTHHCIPLPWTLAPRQPLWYPGDCRSTGAFEVGLQWGFWFIFSPSYSKKKSGTWKKLLFIHLHVSKTKLSFWSRLIFFWLACIPGSFAVFLLELAVGAASVGGTISAACGCSCKQRPCSSGKLYGCWGQWPHWALYPPEGNFSGISVYLRADLCYWG